MVGNTNPLPLFGMVVLDTSPISAITSPTTPIYDGVWTGLEFMQVLSARYNDKESLLVIGRNSNDEVGIYVLDDQVLDVNPGIGKRYQCRLYTRYFHFNSGFDIKRLLHTNLWLEDIDNDLTVIVYYRTDGLGVWKKSGEANITVEDASPNGRVRNMRIYPSETGCSPDGMPGDDHAFYSCQFCIEFTGQCKIAKVQFQAELLTQDIYIEGCEGILDVTTTPGTKFITLYDYGYRI